MNREGDRSCSNLDRRKFLTLLATGAVSSTLPSAFGALESAAKNAVKLPPLHSVTTEAKEVNPNPGLSPGERVGFAIVGLGHLALEQILPAFGSSKYARPVALVSGNHSKAQKLASQYNITEEAIYDYSTFDRLADNREVQVIYIVLPNGMHAEFTIRGAHAGKHILCEKPMAVSVEEGEKMLKACNAAGVKLMVAYRSQYEPLDRAIVKLVREGKLGRPLHFIGSNSQDQGDPSQWRLNRRLAGGGPLPDVGIYCINAARFLTGEEPVEVFGQTEQIPGDSRFREVESSVQFLMKFPSGFAASCNASYDCHRSQFLRLECSDGWAELNPAFAYKGLRLKHGRMLEGNDVVTEVQIESKDQFALEIDHMAQCVLANRRPYTGGEEGLQDMRIMAAIYESARTRSSVRLKPPPTTRGPEPDSEA